MYTFVKNHKIGGTFNFIFDNNTYLLYLITLFWTWFHYFLINLVINYSLLSFLQTNLEIENNFLSKSDQSPDTQEHLLCLLSKVMNDINMYKKCVLKGIVVIVD